MGFGRQSGTGGATKLDAARITLQEHRIEAEISGKPNPPLIVNATLINCRASYLKCRSGRRSMIFRPCALLKTINLFGVKR